MIKRMRAKKDEANKKKRKRKSKVRKSSSDKTSSDSDVLLVEEKRDLRKSDGQRRLKVSYLRRKSEPISTVF